MVTDPKSGAELLKASLDLAKPVVETGCQLIEALFGEPFKVAGGMLADQVYWLRWRNRIRIANRAEALLGKHEIAAKVLPPGFLLPLLDAAGDVEDETLQEMWGRLLAASVKAERHQHPIFVDALKKLSSEDATLFEEIARKSLERGGAVPTEVARPWSDAEARAIQRLRAVGLVDYNRPAGWILAFGATDAAWASELGRQLYAALTAIDSLKLESGDA